MTFTETKLKGAYLIDPEPVDDERGSFARTFCRKEFAAHGLHTDWVQSSWSLNKQRGTLRGLHYQLSPYEEIKLVSCTHGALYDVIIDLRKDSPTFMQSLGVKLSGDNRRMLYIPRHFAHGYQTRMEHTEVSYLISEYYHPEYARGIRWDDPAFGIHWPIPERILSERDQSFPLWGTNGQP